MASFDSPAQNAITLAPALFSRKSTSNFFFDRQQTNSNKKYAMPACMWRHETLTSFVNK